MNLQDLKETWNAMDRKLAKTQLIQERIITSLITTRSTTRFSSVKRNYVLGLMWMTLASSAGILIIATNPFDYKFMIQYMPAIFYSICLVTLTIGQLKRYRYLATIDINQESVSSSLQSIIREYERPRKFLNYTLVIFLFTGVFLFPLSFLPRQADKLGWVLALAERLIPISISALLLFVAHKLGAFKERHIGQFKNDLNELNQLKMLAHEVAEE